MTHDTDTGLYDRTLDKSSCGVGFITRKDGVQTRMKEHGAELFAWLEEGGHFYICGDASRMAKDVDVALHEIVAEHRSMSGNRLPSTSPHSSARSGTCATSTDTHHGRMSPSYTPSARN